MAKRVNKNLVVGLTVFTMMVTTVGVVWMLKNLRDQDPQIYVTQAEEAFEKGDPELARRYYLRAHRAAGRTDPKYLVLAGDMAMEGDEAEAALRAWTSAITLDPNCLEAQRKIVEYRLEQARIVRSPAFWEDLLKQATRLRTLDDSLAVGHNAKGRALLGLKDQNPDFEAEGEVALRRAVELDPTNADYASDLAAYNEQSRRREEAEAVHRAFLEDNPGSAAGLRYYSEFLARWAEKLMRSKKRSERAKADEYILAAREQLVKALELHPDDPDLHIAMGKHWYLVRARLLADPNRETDSEGRTADELFDLCRDEFSKAIESDPDGYDAYLALGLVYRRQNPPMLKKALHVYKAREQRPPKTRSGFKGMLNRQLQFRLYAETVETLLQEFVVANPNKKQQARNEEIAQQAEKYLALAVSERGSESAPTHKLRGKLRRLENKRREAIRELETAKQTAQREDWEVDLLLGDLYAKDGQLGVAYRSVKDALAIRPEVPGGWTLLAQISLSLDQPTNALEWAEQALKLQPGHRQARLIRAQALVKLGREDEVPDELKRMQPSSDPSKAKLQQAVILELQGKKDQYIALVEEVLANDPAYMEAVKMAVAYYRGNDQPDRAIDVVNQALEATPDSHSLQALKINLEIPDVEEAEPRMLALIEKSRNPESKAVNFYNYWISRKNPDKAREYLDQSEEFMPDSPVIIERQYRLALSQNDWDRAEAYVKKAGRLNLDGANGEFYRGRLLLGKGEYHRSVEVLRSALNAYPSNSQGYVWLGAALQLSRRHDEAREAYQIAVDLDPTNGQAHLGLAKLAAASKDEDLLYAHLENCAKFISGDPWVKAQLQLKLEKEDPDAGIRQREQIREESPQNLDNLLRLANLYLQTDRLDQAVTMADEVIARVDKSDDATARAEMVWAVSQIYSEAGRTSEAESMLKKQLDQAEDSLQKAGAQLLLARHYRNLAKTAEETALVDEAYMQAASYSDHWNVCFEIARWFHEQGAAAGDTDRLKKAVEWYHRGRDKADGVGAKALLSRYGFDVLMAAREFEAARKEIDEYLATYPNDPRGQLYKGEIDLQMGDLDGALEAFDRFLEKESKSAIGYFRRGTIHYARSSWDQAIADLTQARAMAPKGFDYLHRKRLAAVLELRGDLSAAVAELRSVLSELDERERTKPAPLSVAKLLSEMLGRRPPTDPDNMLAEQEALAMEYKNLLPNDHYWYTVLGRNALRLNSLNKATEYLKKACELSNYESTAVDTAMAAWLQGRNFDTALDFITNEVPKARCGARAHIRWAQALIGKGNKDEALPHFVTALRMAENNPELSAAAAVVMIRELGPEPAVDYARQRVAEDPNDRTYQVMLASMLQLMPSGLPEAGEHWRSLLDASTSPEQRLLPLTALSQLTYAMKDFEASRGYYEELLSYYTDVYERTQDATVRRYMAGVLNNLAYLLAEDLNQPELALPHATEAVSVAGDNAAILDTLGWIQVLLGHHRKAIGTLTRAIELQQDAPEFHLHIAEAYAREGTDMRSAAKECRRAYELAVARNNTAVKQKIEELAAKYQIELTAHRTQEDV